MLQTLIKSYDTDPGWQMYLQQSVASDSAFPFERGDDVVVRVLPNRGVLLTPPTEDPDVIDVPDLAEHVREEIDDLDRGADDVDVDPELATDGSSNRGDPTA